MNTTRLRVVQWATGNIGLRALREVIRHPALELVGVLVYDAEKHGVDAVRFTPTWYCSTELDPAWLERH